MTMKRLLLCALYVTNIRSAPHPTENPENRHCPPGWIFYRRPSNRTVCHKFFELRNNGALWDEMRQQCKRMGARLSGFETQEEFNLLREVSSIYSSAIGGHVRPECRRFKNVFDKDENATCSKKNIFVWDDGVSSNQALIADNFDDVLDDETWMPKDFCLQMTGINSSTGPINAYPCRYKWHNYMCQYDVDVPPEDVLPIATTPSNIITVPLNEPPRKLKVNPNKTYCAPGWSFYLRPNKRAVCHQFFELNNDGRGASWEGMRQECIKKGFHLSGFETQEEFDLLRSFSPLSVSAIGGYVRSECKDFKDISKFDNDENAKCTKKNIFVWDGDVATNLDVIAANFDYHFWDDQPSVPKEFCLEMSGVRSSAGPISAFPCNYKWFSYNCQYDVYIPPEDFLPIATTPSTIITAPASVPPRRLTVNPAKRYCKPGWIFYLRPSNRAVCHGFNRMPKLRYETTWSFLQKQCQKDWGKGCFLSGFETVEEYEKIRDILGIKNYEAAIGAYIRTECKISFGPEVMPVYDPDENSPCSRKNIFVWANNVSSNLTIIPDYFLDIRDDRSGKPKEYCLRMLPRKHLRYQSDKVFTAEDCKLFKCHKSKKKKSQRKVLI